MAPWGRRDKESERGPAGRRRWQEVASITREAAAGQRPRGARAQGGRRMVPDEDSTFQTQEPPPRHTPASRVQAAQSGRAMMRCDTRASDQWASQDIQRPGGRTTPEKLLRQPQIDGWCTERESTGTGAGARSGAGCASRSRCVWKHAAGGSVAPAGLFT